jgi:hypothetical protein
MKPLKSEIRKDAELLIKASIESIFNSLHHKYATTNGDITPSQHYALNKMQDDLTLLIAEQVFQNIDLTSINLEQMGRSDLMELAYSLDWNGSWDDDEEGQEPITREELIKAINDMIFQNY